MLDRTSLDTKTKIKLRQLFFFSKVALAKMATVITILLRHTYYIYNSFFFNKINYLLLDDLVNIIINNLVPIIINNLVPIIINDLITYNNK